MRIFLLLLIFAPIFSFAQQGQQAITGSWTLADIKASDSVWVATAPESQVAATGTTTAKTEKQKIAVADYMKKDLKIGITKLVFTPQNTFEFFRKQTLTYGGTYHIDGDKLTFNYGSKDLPSQKTNRVVSITATQLVLETESNQKKVLMYFTK